MTFETNKIATCGEEVRSDKIVAWTVDGKWASIIMLALEMYFEEEK